MIVFLDTNAYTAYLRGIPDAVELVEHANELAISMIVIGELKAGFTVGSKTSRNLEQLERVLDNPRVTVPAIDESLTDRYAAIFAQVRRDGRPIPTNDLWIAASVLENAGVLFTYDAHFAHVKGLRLVTTKDDLEAAL